MEKDDIKKLAELSRIEIHDADIPGYQADFENILGYINTITSVDVTTGDTEEIITNVMREDIDPYSAGEFSADILAEAPETDNDFIRVQKIL